jgi:hypothetical protein
MTMTAASPRHFGSETEPPGMEVMADRCDLNIVQSPYPPISSGPYPPIAEFITADWAGSGGIIRADKTAILDGTTGMARTFGDYHSTMKNVAASLRYEYMVEENSTVALFCPNHVDYLPIALAVSLCGAKMVPINPLYTRQELQLILQRSNTTVLITHTSTLGPALEAVKAISRPIHVSIAFACWALPYIVYNTMDYNNTYKHFSPSLESTRWSS